MDDTLLGAFVTLAFVGVLWIAYRIDERERHRGQEQTGSAAEGDGRWREDVAQEMLDVAWHVSERKEHELLGGIKISQPQKVDPGVQWIELKIILVIFPLHLILEEGKLSALGGRSLMGPLSVLYIDRLREGLRQHGFSRSRQIELTNRIPDALDRYEAAVSGKSKLNGTLSFGSWATKRLTGDSVNVTVIAEFFPRYYEHLKNAVLLRLRLENYLANPREDSKRRLGH